MKTLLFLAAALAAASPLNDIEERHFNLCPPALCCVKGSEWTGKGPYWTSAKERMMYSKALCGQKCAADTKCQTYAVSGGVCRLYKSTLWSTVKPSSRGSLDFASACCAPKPKPKPSTSSCKKSSTSTRASSTAKSTSSSIITSPSSTKASSTSSSIITSTSSISSVSPTSTPPSSSSSSPVPSSTSETPIITPTPSSTSSPSPSSTSAAPPAPTCNFHAFISQKYSEDAYYDYNYDETPSFSVCQAQCKTRAPKNLYTKKGTGSCLIFAATEDYCLLFYQLEGNPYIPVIADSDPSDSIYAAYLNDVGCPDPNAPSSSSSAVASTPTPEITPTPSSTLVTSSSTPTPSSTTPAAPAPTCGVSALIGPGYDAVFSYNYDVPPSFATCKLECETLTNPRASGPCVIFGVPKRDTDGYCLLTYPKAGSTFVPTIDKLYATDSQDAALWYDVGCTGLPPLA